mmetsp:Transcript_11788/g.30181  ORF Transcript_11788/g.30181 Transcript_11788/m.30181 type:complete len:339 (-) Transcript_11788:353-1369(-)
MRGTASSVPFHRPKAATSASIRPSAARTATARLARLDATTSFKSSTLYSAAPGTPPTSGCTLRGTEMSTIRRSRVGSAAASASLSSTSSAPAAQNTTSALRKAGTRPGMPVSTMSTSGNSAASASARGRERLTTVTARTPFACRCLSSSRPILPAPMTTTWSASSGGRPACASLSAASSAAAPLTLTAPSEMAVSERTRLPTVTAALKTAFSTRPKCGSPCPVTCTCRTCARICPSPTTSESRPAATRMRCSVASSPRCAKRLGRSSSRRTPLAAHSHASTSRTAGWKERATTYTSSRLQVDSTAASWMCGYAHSSSTTRGASASGMASRSRSSTGVL